MSTAEEFDTRLAARGAPAFVARLVASQRYRLALDERQKVGVDDVGVRCKHSVWVTRINL